jgi:hypothetical protein
MTEGIPGQMPMPSPGRRGRHRGPRRKRLRRKAFGTIVRIRAFVADEIKRELSQYDLRELAPGRIFSCAVT